VGVDPHGLLFFPEYSRHRTISPVISGKVWVDKEVMP